MKALPLLVPTVSPHLDKWGLLKREDVCDILLNTNLVEDSKGVDFNANNAKDRGKVTVVCFTVHV